MVFFDLEACALRERWGDIDVKSIDFEMSPFGLTVDGCKDFRGFTVTGKPEACCVFQSQRFEKCDFALAVFQNSRIIKGVCVGLCCKNCPEELRRFLPQFSLLCSL